MDVLDWLSNELYDYTVKAVSWMIIKVQTGFILYSIEVIKFSWDVAKQIITDLGITGKFNEYWGLLPDSIESMAGFFKIPDAINMLFSAHITRWVMGYAPGFRG